MKTQHDIAIIDCHTHCIGDDPLESIRLLHDGISEHTESNRYTVLSLSGGDFLCEKTVLQNLVCLLLKAQHPDQVYAFGGLYHYFQDTNPSAIDHASNTALLLDAGFDGMKMIEGKPTAWKKLSRPLGAPYYDSYYALLAERGKPLLMHVADPDYDWDAARITEDAKKRGFFYGDGSFPSWEQLHVEAENIVKKHPALRMVFAHFFYLAIDLSRARRLLDTYENVMFDICLGPQIYRQIAREPDVFREFFLRYQDRLLFGTDFVGSDLKNDIQNTEMIRRVLETDDAFPMWDETLQGILLPEAVLEKVYRTNFDRLVGPINPINPGAATKVFAQAEQLIGLLDNKHAAQQKLALLWEHFERCI